MITSTLARLESLSLDMSCPIELDYSAGTTLVANTQYSQSDILMGLLPRVPENEMPFTLRYLMDNDWIVRRGDNDCLHFYNVLNQYIGEMPAAIALYKLDVRAPVVCIQSDGECSPDHKVTSVGYSHLLNSWITWGYGSLQTAPSSDKAHEYSYLNSKITLDNTMELKRLLSSAMSNEAHEMLLNAVKQDPEGLPVRAQLVLTDKGSMETAVERLADKPELTDGPVEGNTPEPKEAPVKLEVGQECCDDQATVDVEGAPSMESEGTVTYVEQRRTVGRVSGEHMQHNIRGFGRERAFSDMPRSGEHRQHNADPRASYPGYRRPIVEGSGQVSESAAAVSVLDFDWYRYIGKRKRSYTEHHRSYDLEIEPTEIFGLKAARGGFQLMPKEEMEGDAKIMFKLSEKEVALLLKHSKKFTGKIRGIKATLTTNVSTDKAPAPTISDVVIDKAKSTGHVYIGAVLLSQFDDRATAVIGNNQDDLITAMQERVRVAKAAVPSAMVFQLPAEHDLVKRIAAKPNVRINMAVLRNVAARGNIAVRTVHFTKNMQQYTQTPREPKSAKPTSLPIFEFTSMDVLSEIKMRINEGYYSAEFKPGLVRSSKLVMDTAPDSVASILKANDKQPARLALYCQNTSPMFLKEANDVIGRLQQTYSRHLIGKVQEVSINNIRYACLLLTMSFKKRSAAAQERSIIIYEMWKRQKAPSTIGAELSRIDTLARQANMQIKTDDPKALAEQREARDMLDALSRRLAESASTTLVLDSPIYKCKLGSTLITVTVKDVNIAAGTVTVKPVRGNLKEEEVTNLYTYTERKIF